MLRTCNQLLRRLSKVQNWIVIYSFELNILYCTRYVELGVFIVLFKLENLTQFTRFFGFSVILLIQIFRVVSNITIFQFKFNLKFRPNLSLKFIYLLFSGRCNYRITQFSWYCRLQHYSRDEVPQLQKIASTPHGNVVRCSHIKCGRFYFLAIMPWFYDCFYPFHLVEIK